MKLNKIMKVIVTILLIALISVFVSQVAFAEEEGAGGGGGGKGYTTDSTLDTMFGQAKDTSGASQAAGNMIGMIINIAQVIGTGVAIIMLIVLAIKYISAAPEGKAEVKKNATIYIVGAVILFAASGILSIVRRFAVKSINNEAIKATDVGG